MSFSERRYETLSAGAPIFGIQAALWVETNALVPIIPNIGALCSVWSTIGIAPFGKQHARLAARTQERSE
jgi:hypothetical protein